MCDKAKFANVGLYMVLCCEFDEIFWLDSLQDVERTD